MKPLNLCFVINYIEYNGPSNVLLNLIANLPENKYHITLITLFEENNKEIIRKLRNSSVVVIQCKSLSRMGCVLGISSEFNNIVAREKFDIIHTHGFIPDILSSRLDISVKRVSTLHNNVFEDYLDTYGTWKSRLFIPIHIAALKKMDQCICCSQSVYNAMKPHLLNAAFVRNGIGKTNANSIITRKSLNIPDNARVFIFVGRLNTRKNIYWLIRSFVNNHIENEYMIVLGDGELMKDCREAADDHVKILGFQKDPIAYLKISDIYVSASRSEGLSISMLEALDNGLALLVSDIPSHREVLNLSLNLDVGELFTENTFENSFSKLREKNFDKRLINEFKNKELSAKNMTEAYQKIYEDI